MEYDPDIARAAYQRRALSIWLLLMLPLLLTVMISAWVAYNELYRLKVDPIITRHGELLDQISHQLSQKLGYFGQLTLLLKRSYALSNSLHQDAPPQLHQLAQHFERVSRSSGLMSQLRWLDNSGREQVRTNVIQGKPQQVATAELQDKSQRYYVRAARQLAADHVYYSPLDLNIEHGRIATPLDPTLRTVIRTGSDNLHPGMLVLNFSLQTFFQQLRQQSSTQTQPGMVNANGYWLLHQDPAQEWGFLRQQPDLTVQQQYPQLWQRMQDSPSGRGINLYGQLWSYTQIQPDTTAAADTDTSRWYLLLSTPPGMITTLRQSLLLPVTLGSVLVLLLGGLVIYRVARIEAQRVELLHQLSHERSELQSANVQLKQSLHHQQVLQDELVETRKLSALGMTVAGVAHELNTPTGGALMTLSTLENDRHQLQTTVDDGHLTRAGLTDYLARTHSGIALIRHHLDKATALIRSFKRLALERNLEAPVNFTLQACVDDLLHSLQVSLKQSSVTLEQALPDCTLYSHPGILSQVLQNLIDNALQHAFDEGSRGHIRLSGQLTASGQLELQVSDNGHGIPAEILPTLFDPFITSGRGQGHTGLGLHLVHQWVTQTLHGKIQVESSAQGSCFTLTLPLDLRDHPAAP